MSDALSLIHHVPSFIAWMPGAAEWIVIAAFGLILFGKRLPEVGRSLGKGIVEFKKGLKGVEDEVDEAVNNPTPSRSTTEHKFDPYTGKPIQPALPTGAKFDPYTGKPVDQAVEVSHDAGHEKVS
jgi:sec-independent protein translocase protein TatA